MKHLKKFNEGFKDTIYGVYSELNPVLKLKKMKKYHDNLKKEVSDLEKEIEEKKKSIKKLEGDLKNK